MQVILGLTRIWSTWYGSLVIWWGHVCEIHLQPRHSTTNNRPPQKHDSRSLDIDAGTEEQVAQHTIKLQPAVCLAMTSRTTSINSPAAKRVWEQTMDLMCEMRSHRLVPCVVTYSAAISACTRKKQWSQALDILGDMQCARVEPNVVTYNSAIKACGVGLHWDGALKILDQMLANGVPTNVRTHNTLLDVFVRARLWKTALQLLGDMPSFGVQPDVISYNTVLNGCLSCTQWGEALQVLSSMQREGIVPDVVTYNSLIKGIGMSKQWATSLALLREMIHNPKKPDPNIVTYGAAISSCARCNQWEQALALYNEWRTAGNEPDQMMMSTLARGVFPNMILNASQDEPLYVVPESFRAKGSREVGARTLSEVGKSMRFREQRGHWARALRLLQNFENCAPHTQTESSVFL